MYEPLECIALRTTRISDSKSLLSVWERSRGRLTFAIPAGASREARRRRAITAPMMLFDCQCDLRPGRDIYSVKELTAADVTAVVDRSPAKGMTGMFLGEFLDLLLRRADADRHLSDFLFGSAQALSLIEDMRAVANFHIIFLYRLAHFTGIEPNLETGGDIFDLREARFRGTDPLHSDFLEGRAANMVRIIGRFGYDRAYRLPFDRSTRKNALDIILRYFSIHLSSLDSLKSLDVLRAMIE